MDLETRKIEFIRSFLEIKDEQSISHLENILDKELQSHFKAMSVKELEARISKSEENFKQGLYKDNSELIAKYTK